MPEPPRFDPIERAWILTRYDDVLAALKEPGLLQTGRSGPIDAEEQQRARAQVLAALPLARSDEWQPRMEASARDILARLPEDRSIDLVSALVKPWCQAAVPIVMPGYLKPLSKGLTETLPAFLSNALLDLIRNPDELRKLRAEPQSMTRAVEELLRHASLVHTLLRTATEDIEIGGEQIARGQRVILKLAEANRDSERFCEAERLDVGRKQSGHLSLGAGEHSCAGALAVRLASSVVVGAFAAEFRRAELAGPVEWHDGSTLAWPVSLPAMLRR